MWLNLYILLKCWNIFYCNRKQCITSESQFDFLKELVENIPDLPANEEEADDLDEPKPKRYGVRVDLRGTWEVGMWIPIMCCIL